LGLVCKRIENEITVFNLKMALAMQQAMEFLPSISHMVEQMSHQSWWREGIVIVSSVYLGEQTWELIVRYDTRLYGVVYDVNTKQCDDIEPLCEL
jgi:hypothetical protein